MTEQDTAHKPDEQSATKAAHSSNSTGSPARPAAAWAQPDMRRGRRRSLAGYFIAGASLAVLFGIAALKGRVRDDNTDSEGGLE